MEEGGGGELRTQTSEQHLRTRADCCSDSPSTPQPSAVTDPSNIGEWGGGGVGSALGRHEKGIFLSRDIGPRLDLDGKLEPDGCGGGNICVATGLQQLPEDLKHVRNAR